MSNARDQFTEAADKLRAECQRMQDVLRVCRAEGPQLADQAIRTRVLERRLEDSQRAIDQYDRARRAAN